MQSDLPGILSSLSTPQSPLPQQAGHLGRSLTRTSTHRLAVRRYGTRNTSDGGRSFPLRLSVRSPNPPDDENTHLDERRLLKKVIYMLKHCSISYQIISTYFLIIKKSPYNVGFGNKPKIGLTFSNLLLDLNKKIFTEKQREEIYINQRQIH